MASVEEITTALREKFMHMDLKTGLVPGEMSIRARVINGMVHVRIVTCEFPIDDFDKVKDQTDQLLDELSSQ